VSAPAELGPRPHVPASAACATSAVATAALLLELAWRAHAAGAPLPHGAARALAAGAAGSILLLAAVRFSRARTCPPQPRPDRGGRRSRALPWAACAIAGVFTASAASGLWMARADAAAAVIASVPPGERVLVIRGDPSITDRGASASAVMRTADGGAAAKVRLNLPRPLEDGTALTAVCRMRPFEEGEWERARYLRGEAAALDAVRVTRILPEDGAGPLAALRRRLLAVLDPRRSPGRALVAGVICGRTTELAREAAYEDFSTAGLTHLVAVSGSHLALIASLFAGALRPVRGRRVARLGALIALMGAYVVFTGCAPSAMRSLAMVAASHAAALARRRPHSLSGLALAVTLLVALDPGCVYDLGFQLSSVSVLFITALAPYLAHHLELLRLPRALARPLACTLAAQIATAPITAPVFGSVSLIAPLANLIAGPAMSLLLALGLPALPVAALAPSLDVVWCLEGLANLSISWASLLAHAPYASVALDLGPLFAFGVYAVAAGVFAAWREVPPRVLARALALLVIAGALWWGRWRLAAPAGISVLDVGQADAILIRDGAAAVLVDAGVDGRAATALARQRVLHLDAIVITHWDRDHWGGIAEVLRSVPTDRIIVAAGAAAFAPPELRDAWKGPIDEVAVGDGIEVGGFSCRVVWPLESVGGEKNADSLCLAVSFDRGGSRMRALLTGDTELDQELAYAPEVGDIDVLKVGHHGSKASVDAEFLALIDPEVAVASAGADNSYGHPSREAVGVLERAGVAFWCTIDAGDVVLEPDRDGVRVRASAGDRRAEVG